MRSVSALRLALQLAVALGLAASLAAAGHAAKPEVRCQKAVAKSLSACIGKLSKAEVACYKKTGAACAADHKKVERALAGAAKSVTKKCRDAASVEAAGYAPLAPAELGALFAETCDREVTDLVDEVFGGPDGPHLSGASKADAKCLLAAGKEGGKLLGRAIEATGSCAGKSCTIDKLGAIGEKRAKAESKSSAKIARKCPDLAGLIGLDPTEFAAERAARFASAAAAPCDPIDPAHCFFPFANDYFTVPDRTSPTGRRLHFVRNAMPANSPAGTDPPPPVRVDTSKLNVADGFSVGPTLLFQNTELDLEQTGATPITDIGASLEPGANVMILDAETGERQLLFVERDLKGATLEESALIGRVGANLENGRRYLVAVRDARDADGELLPASPVFAAYRDGTPIGQLPVEARRPHMEQIFAELEGFGVARESLYLAWDFTTQSVESTASRMLHMRDDAFERLGDAAPAFEVTKVEPQDPGSGLLRRVEGTFQVPLYLTNGGVPGSELRLGPDGLPVNEGDFFTARFLCVIPLSASTGGETPEAVPARPSLYGHGLLGSRGETGASHVRGFANAHNFVMCGTDWTGFADEDQGTAIVAVLDFSSFPVFLERQHQGILNFLMLGRLMIHPDGFASHEAFQVGGESVIDPSGLFYDGNSQGGIMGGVLAAFAQDVERFVLGVPGINYSVLLDRSKDFAPFELVMTGSYPNRLDRALLIALAQVLWDRTDPSGHVRHTTADTYPDTPPKKILYQVAYGDQQVANFTVEVAARSNGAHLQTPALDPGKVVPEVEPFFGIPEIPSYPFDGSAVVIWDSGNPPPPIGNVPPPEIGEDDPEWADLMACPRNFGSDPHECPRRDPKARLQKSEFLKNDGAVVDTCGGVACTAP